ncbi:tail fiber domain-containing protein [Dyadobacter crusticola]|uniref:tail fiber domain-containing protein n=1 Tax=Dyadobacter crusticola TaxID=292407 RepID=UPI0004E1151B|nr:tail fiber domain-containing protein [Dyadobacter crusticola]
MKPKQLLTTTFFVVLTAVSTSFAQVKIGANPTTISANANLDVEDNSGGHMVVLKNGNVGVGIAAPTVKLNVQNGNLSVNQGPVNTFGTGVQAAASFGTGNANNGWYSISVGQNNVASGQNSLVIGFDNFTSANGRNAFTYGSSNQAIAGNSLAGGTSSYAAGNNSVALGQSTQATGAAAITLGYNNLASGNNSVAIGHTTRASGASGISIGYNTTASGANSIAFGHSSTASGPVSFAVGYLAVADGNNSFAIGRQARALHDGSMVISDGYVTDVNSFANNSLHMRFVGGYTLRTAANNVGVRLQNGDVTWSSVSDIRAKKDITDIQDGLAAVMKLRPKKYHYKETDEKHYSLGFIAQEAIKVLPDVVNTPEDKSDFMSIRYTEIIPVLTKAIQEQQAEIEALKFENQALKTQVEKVDNLAAKLVDIEARLQGISVVNGSTTLEKSK